jgi:uncharacterized protein
LDKNDALRILREFRKLLELNGVKDIELILFGSFARGDYNEFSDIDVIVISDTFEGKGMIERIEILSEAIYKLFEPIEALPVTKKEWEDKTYMICEFASEGERVG